MAVVIRILLRRVINTSQERNLGSNSRAELSTAGAREAKLVATLDSFMPVEVIRLAACALFEPGRARLAAMNFRHGPWTSSLHAPPKFLFHFEFIFRS
jgi:hypothetical protein